MPEFLPEALKGFKEYLEWAKAPGELAALIQSVGGCGEQVLYKGYARYLNTEVFLDKPKGIIVVTDRRFVFLTKKKPLPFVSNTERLMLPLRDLNTVEGTKYRLGYVLRLVVDRKAYLFGVTNLNTFATKQQVDELARLIAHAKPTGS